MPATDDTTQRIDAFGEHYGYDVTYMHELHEASPEGYALFESVIPMASYRKHLSLDASTVARVTVMQHEDCGPCLQLAIDMAKEAGVASDLLRAALDKNTPMDEPYETLRRYIQNVINNTPIEPETEEKMYSHYGAQGMAELALAIAACRMFPTIKRALGHAKSCSLVSVGV